MEFYDAGTVGERRSERGGQRLRSVQDALGQWGVGQLTRNCVVSKNVLRRSVLGGVFVVGCVLSGCSAGQIGPILQSSKPVEIGLAEAQVELRVQADTLSKTPWSAPKPQEATSASMSMGSVIGILLTGLPQDEQSQTTPAPAPVDPTLSSDAQTYMMQLHRAGGTPETAVAALTSDVRRRISGTQSFALLSRKVLGGAVVNTMPRGRSDLAVIRETIENLKAQHAVFLETARSYRGYMGVYAAQNAMPVLADLNRKIADLESVVDAMSRQLTTV